MTDNQPPAISPEPSDAAPRIVAFIEVLLCSDFLTQIAIGGTLAAFGIRPMINGRLSVGYVVALSLGDAALLIGLILIMLYAHGERPRDVFFGRRSAAGEAILGAPMTLIALLLGAAVILTVRKLAPQLRTVPENPLQDMLRSPRDAWLFALVALAAGGVREEIQRAFLLHRFDVWLGGPVVGVIVTSVAFGAGHLLQGIDAAITTGVLGGFWAAIYLRRRSSVAPMVSHAGFDLLQIVPYLGLR